MKERNKHMSNKRKNNNYYMYSSEYQGYKDEPAGKKDKLLLLYIPIYLLAFFIIDSLPLTHYIIRCPLDSYISFNQYMVIPYAIWYIWVPGWLLYFMNKSGREFRRLAVVMFSGMTVSLIIYLIFPNGIDLREPVTGTDVCSKAVQLIRYFDTPYGVCPSIHITTITAIMLSIKNSRISDITSTVEGYCMVITLLIGYSTMGIKQHSIVDIVCGVILSMLIYYIYEYFTKKKAGK